MSSGSKCFGSSRYCDFHCFVLDSRILPMQGSCSLELSTLSFLHLIKIDMSMNVNQTRNYAPPDDICALLLLLFYRPSSMKEAPYAREGLSTHRKWFRSSFLGYPSTRSRVRGSPFVSGRLLRSATLLHSKLLCCSIDSTTNSSPPCRPIFRHRVTIWSKP